MFPRYRNHGGGGNNVAHDPKHNISMQNKIMEQDQNHNHWLHSTYVKVSINITKATFTKYF